MDMNTKQLKITACICMLYDHVDRIFPFNQLLSPLWDGLYNVGLESVAENLMTSLKYIGRLAAPIFLFCIVNGFFHTHDKKSYIKRVAITAIIAQLPYILFDFAQLRFYGLSGELTTVALNILFTMTVGLAALWFVDTSFKKKQWLIGSLGIAAACLLTTYMNMEGKYGYILILFGFYFLKDQKRWMQALCFIPLIILSRFQLVMIGFSEPQMISSIILNVFGNYLGVLIPILFYNGEKGNISKRMQLGMYAFYPIHLLILGIIGMVK